MPLAAGRFIHWSSFTVPSDELTAALQTPTSLFYLNLPPLPPPPPTFFLLLPLPHNKFAISNFHLLLYFYLHSSPRSSPLIPLAGCPFCASSLRPASAPYNCLSEQSNDLVRQECRLPSKSSCVGSRCVCSSLNRGSRKLRNSHFTLEDSTLGYVSRIPMVYLYGDNSRSDFTDETTSTHTLPAH